MSRAYCTFPCDATPSAIASHRFNSHLSQAHHYKRREVISHDAHCSITPRDDSISGMFGQGSVCVKCWQLTFRFQPRRLFQARSTLPDPSVLPNTKLLAKPDHFHVQLLRRLRHHLVGCSKRVDCYFMGNTQMQRIQGWQCDVRKTLYHQFCIEDMQV